MIVDAPKKYELRKNPSKRKYSTNWLTDPVPLEYVDSRECLLHLLFSWNTLRGYRNIR